MADLIDRLSTQEKQEVQARIFSLDSTAIKPKPTARIVRLAIQCHGYNCCKCDDIIIISTCRYHRSFTGKDFKGWAQVCLFVVWDYLTDAEKKVWLTLSQVYHTT